MSARRTTVAAGLVAALSLVGLLAITMRKDEPRRTASQPTAVTPGPTAVVASATPSVAVVTTSPGVLAKAPTPAAASVDPEDDPAWRELKPGDIAPGDLFEPEGDIPPRARKLTSYGTITLGVLGNAKLKDEDGAITVLRKLGAELDRLEVGRNEPPHKRAAAYSDVIRRYRDELRDKLDGAVVVRGTAWFLTVDPSRDPPDAH